MKNKIIWMLSVAVLLFVSKCDQLSTESDEPELSEIEEALTILVEQDSTLSLEGYFDDGVYSGNYDFDGGMAKVVSAEDTLPSDYGVVRFGRYLTGDFDREVDITVNGDTAYALVRMTVNGEFRVVFIDTSDTSGSEPDPVIKPFVSTALQRLRFLRVRHTRNPRLNWKVDAISPKLINTTGNPISLTGISLSSANGNFSGFSLEIVDSSSVLDYLISRENLPVFERGDSVAVEVSVENPDPFFYEPGEMCLMHYGVKRRFFKFRRELSDPENDNTFNGTWRIHRHVGRMCRVVFDVIDLASIYDTEAPFHSIGIGFPYRVVR